MIEYESVKVNEDVYLFKRDNEVYAISTIPLIFKTAKMVNIKDTVFSISW